MSNDSGMEPCNINISNIEQPPNTPPDVVSNLLYLTYLVTKWLSHPYSISIIVPMLCYHLFVYIYLGAQAGGPDFYTGFMYAFNYAGTSVAYWIICRQSRQLLDGSHIISNELVPPTTSKCIYRCVSGCNGIYYSTHFQLLQNLLALLRRFPDNYKDYQQYCKNWNNRTKWIFLIWMGFATINIVLKALPDSLIKMYTSFDDKPLGLYGYYNLSGQFLAPMCIVTAAVTMLSGFYILQCLILGFAKDLRKYRIKMNNILPPQNQRIVRLTTLAKRETYLNIQKACVALGELWSPPVMISLFFCTQVVISNILVIHYSLADCVKTENCGFLLIYPFIWMIAGLFIIGYILTSMASINQASNTLRQIFVYSKDGNINTEDYACIGGRRSWIDYQKSNRLEFCIGGMAITPTFVVNICYTVSTGIASFLASNLFGS